MRQRIIPILVLIFSFHFSFCQKAQPIHGIAKENQPVSWYEEQSQLWQAEIQNASDNTEAWLNYYLAERAKLQLTRQDLWPNKKAEVFAMLEPIIEQAQKNIPNTFDLNFIQGFNNDGEEKIKFFKKAFALDPDRSEVYGELLVYAIRTFEDKNAKTYAEKMLEHNVYSHANLQWNDNAMKGIDKNAIFFTNGDLDCIPKWVLQNSLNIRPDVLVVSKWLLADDSNYQKEIFQQIALKAPKKGRDQFASLSEYADYLVVYIMKNAKRSSYISAGTPKSFFLDQGIESDIYVVGNALKHATKPFDNTALIKKNFEEHYQMEYLFNHFQRHHEDDMVKERMNLTYLPALFHLKKYYAQEKNWTQEKYYDKLIDKIASESGRKEQVLSWFK